jgi:hypothetical protein
LSALARAKAKAQGIACLSKLKQLGLAWRMYTHDNNNGFFVVDDVRNRAV